MTTLTKAARLGLLLGSKCTEAEFRTQRICTKGGEAVVYVVQATYNGQSVTLGVWGALNQRSVEQVQEIIEQRIAAAAVLLARAQGVQS